jgi:RNA recognition motif-containing protein
MNIYISNLNSSIQNKNLTDLFSSYGNVSSAEIALDVFTGVSRGFGYVVMEDDACAQTAINSLNNSEWESLTITVQQAEPKAVRKGSYKVGSGASKENRFRKN